ncbi:cytochrome P450 6j1-like [Diabrotica undecimpunctata]|uniref:cytochrome P450 6j1-like n=1 Tax=Diabrotica undecimpunctata TaxID=50387 RepID=UPI003B63964C
MLLTSSWLIDTTIFLILIVFLVYKHVTRNSDFWKKRNIPYVKPTLFFGNFYEVFTFKTTIHEQIKKLYDKVDAPYFGIFIFDEPLLVLKDPKLIKDVLIKDAAVFANRRPATPTHPLMEHSVFFLKYPYWKKIRTKLTPLFTTVMLKNMHNDLSEVCKSMTGFLCKHKEVIDGGHIGELFTTEFIFKWFFGANLDCFAENPPPLGKLVQNTNEFSLRNSIVQNLFFIKPSWVTTLKLNFISDTTLKFFEDIFKKGMKARQEYDGKPQNYVDFANKALRDKQNGKEDVMDLEMSVSSAIFFLIAGKDALNTLLAFTLYELSLNENIQNKLREEIRENVQKFNGITYDGIQENKYLEMCVNETIRKYPPIPFIDRMPLSDYTFEGTDLKVQKDMTVIVPFYALHRDEKHFSNPDVFNPDRFAGDIEEGVYIPFGGGPRNCIGKRLGMLGLSVAVSYIVLNFQIEKCPDTPNKLEFDPKSFALISKTGLPIKITPIENEKCL